MYVFGVEVYYGMCRSENSVRESVLFHWAVLRGQSRL